MAALFVELASQGFNHPSNSMTLPIEEIWVSPLTYLESLQLIKFSLGLVIYTVNTHILRISNNVCNLHHHINRLSLWREVVSLTPHNLQVCFSQHISWFHFGFYNQSLEIKIIKYCQLYGGLVGVNILESPPSICQVGPT